MAAPPSLVRESITRSVLPPQYGQRTKPRYGAAPPASVRRPVAHGSPKVALRGGWFAENRRQVLTWVKFQCCNSPGHISGLRASDTTTCCGRGSRTTDLEAHRVAAGAAATDGCRHVRRGEDTAACRFVRRTTGPGDGEEIPGWRPGHAALRRPRLGPPSSRGQGRPPRHRPPADGSDGGSSPDRVAPRTASRLRDRPLPTDHATDGVARPWPWHPSRSASASSGGSPEGGRSVRHRGVGDPRRPHPEPQGRG